jgi:hypothetical protein
MIGHRGGTEACLDKKKMSREGNLTMKAKRKVKVKFQIQLQTMNNVPAALNDASIFIAWKRGGKKDNKVGIQDNNNNNVIIIHS